MVNDKVLNFHPTGLETGSATLSRDGSKLFFTGWTKNRQEKRSAIYVVSRTDTGWTVPVPAGAPLNLPDANSSQPFLTPDGHYLLFCSDRKGGLGQQDIWYCTMDKNLEPVTAVNLGATINTTRDDVSPYYHAASRTLVFSSNGRTGMGGYDFYYAKRAAGFSNWSQPENPGIPFNSSKDELYFTSTDALNLWNTAWFSSDRNSNCCLALFSATLNHRQIISGRILDCHTLQAPAGCRCVGPGKQQR